MTQNRPAKTLGMVVGAFAIALGLSTAVLPDQAFARSKTQAQATPAKPAAKTATKPADRAEAATRTAAARVKTAAQSAKAEYTSARPEGDADALATGSIDDGPACSKQRRRLWLEGEGWIVRRVSVCH